MAPYPVNSPAHRIEEAPLPGCERSRVRETLLSAYRPLRDLPDDLRLLLDRLR